MLPDSYQLSESKRAKREVIAWLVLMAIVMGAILGFGALVLWALS